MEVFQLINQILNLFMHLARYQKFKKNLTYPFELLEILRKKVITTVAIKNNVSNFFDRNRWLEKKNLELSPNNEEF